MATYTKSSRYALNDSGMTASRKTPTSVSYSHYLTKDGDSFRRLAGIVFNDETRYWEIADINPQVSFPDEIPLGTLIRIPE